VCNVISYAVQKFFEAKKDFKLFLVSTIKLNVSYLEQLILAGEISQDRNVKLFVIPTDKKKLFYTIELKHFLVRII